MGAAENIVRRPTMISESRANAQALAIKATRSAVLDTTRFVNLGPVTDSARPMSNKMRVGQAASTTRTNIAKMRSR